MLLTIVYDLLYLCLVYSFGLILTICIQVENQTVSDAVREQSAGELNACVIVTEKGETLENGYVAEIELIFDAHFINTDPFETGESGIETWFG